MAKRDVSKIVGIKNSGQEEVEPEVPHLPQVSIDYPKPIMLSSVLIDVARWSEFNFVLDPGLDRPLQIFATRKMPSDEAFHIFTQSLESIGLRAIRLEGGLVKIVTRSVNSKAC